MIGRNEETLRLPDGSLIVFEGHLTRFITIPSRPAKGVGLLTAAAKKIGDGQEDEARSGPDSTKRFK